MEEEKKLTRASVSACLIAKNEAESLQLCLESIRGTVDEIVVLVDDSTTDNTAEIARQYADIVEPFHWTDDFSAARNLSISKATKEWFFIMDAHEVLHPNSRKAFQDILSRVQPGKDLSTTEVFSATIYMNPTVADKIEDIVPETFFVQPRLVKNNGHHRFIGASHNWLHSDPDWPCEKKPVNWLVVLHRRSDKNEEARQQQRRTMNVKALTADIERDPLNPRPYFYMANTYYELREMDTALEYFQQYLARSDWSAEKAHALLTMASIYANRKEFTKARELLLEAQTLDWERAEIPCMLGDIAYDQKLYYEAEHWWKSAQDMKPPNSGMFLHGPCYTFLPFEKLAALYSGVGELQLALKAGERATQLGCRNQDLIGKIEVWKRQLSLDPAYKNLIIYDEQGVFTFLKDIWQRLHEKYNLASTQEYDIAQAEWGDVLWIEWADKNLVRASHYPKKPGQKWICRLHGYEIFQSGQLRQVDWTKIDVLIFVSDHTKRHFEAIYDTPPNVQKVVIPNGVEMKKWSYALRDKAKSNNVGVIGVLSEKKGPLLLAKAIRWAAKARPELRFLLRLDIPDEVNLIKSYLDYELRDCTNYEWVPRQESMNSWMEDIKWLLSTSTIESFSYVIAEAMAKGIKPLIHDFYGARELWPEDLIWTDFAELDTLFGTNYESARYREWVQSRYSLDRQMADLFNLFEKLEEGK